MDYVFSQLTNVFNWVMQSSLFAIVSIAIIAAAQFAGRRLLPARWLYALWLLLLIRLLMPAGPESRLSLWNFLPQAMMEDGFISSYEVLNIDSNGEKNVAARKSGENAPVFQQKRAINTRVVLAIIWLAGALVMIAVIAVNNFRLWRSVRKLRQVTDQPLLELFEDCKQLLRVRTVVGLVITDQVKSPSLFGCIRPRVLLPADLAGQISHGELRFIFLHELAHLKQGDIWIGWIAAFAQSLHWFNPIIWWAFTRMRADREVACDALALSRVKDEEGERYGGALIGLLERFHHSRRLPVVAGILENKAQLKRRLNMITNFRRTTRGEIIAAAALLAVLSIALLTNPPTLLSQSGEQGDNTSAPAKIIGEFRLSPDKQIVKDSASLTGVILDDSGGAVRGKMVTVRNVDTGVGTSTVSNNEGRYFFPSLQTGTYEVETGSPGFDGITHSTVKLDAGVQARFDFDLNGTGTVGMNDQPSFSDDIPYRAPVRVGGAVQESRLIYKISPIYPQEAKDEGISGIVVLNAVINEEGIIKEVAVIDGHPLLIKAAIEAIRQWRYSPTLLDGVPIPVVAELRVNFALF